MGDQEEDQDDLHGAAVDDPNVPPPWAQAMLAQMATGMANSIGQAIGNAMHQQAQQGGSHAGAGAHAAPGHGNLA